jgi:hypothetical protein
MTSSFVLCLIFNIGLILFLMHQARSPTFGPLAGSAVNPMNIFGLISLLFNIDFIVLWNNQDINFLERATPLTQTDVLYAYFNYTMIFCGNFSGFLLAIYYWRIKGSVCRPVKSPLDQKAAQMGAVILFYGVMLYVALVFLLDHHPSSDNLSFQMVSRENHVLSAATMVIAPSFCMFLAHREKLFTGTGFFALVVVVSLPTMLGAARVLPLICLLAFVVAYACARRISPLWYLPGVLFAGVFLAFTRFMFREIEFRGSFGDFLTDQGGLLELFFGGEEISFAKMFTVLYTVAPSVPMPPFWGFLAFLVAPIPRSLLAAKPFGASAILTQDLAPLNWELTASESLITGYGDLYWQFGTLGAAIAMFLIGYFFLRLCMRLMNGPRSSLLMWMPLLIWMMYGFLRGDIFNVSLMFWPAMMILVVHRLLTWCVKRTLRGSAPGEQSASVAGF